MFLTYVPIKMTHKEDILKTVKQKFRTLLPKGAVIAVAACVLALLLCMLVQENRTNTAHLLSNAWGNDTFVYEGKTYFVETTVKNYTKALRILRQADDEANYMFLPGESALWSDTAERFVYRDGKKLKACDITGKNAKTLYSASGFRIFPVPLMTLDRYVVVKNAYRRNNAGIQSVGNFFLIDLTNGSVLETEISAELGRGLTSLCIEDGFLYYSTGSISGTTSEICRCCLETGEYEILATISGADSVAQGCVIEGYLYFRASGKGFYRIPAAGGEVEKLDAGGSGNWPMAEYNGRILFAHTVQEDDDSFSVSAEICDPAKQSAEEVFRLPMEDYDSIVSLRVQNAVITVFSYDGAVFQGEL